MAFEPSDLLAHRAPHRKVAGMQSRHLEPGAMGRDEFGGDGVEILEGGSEIVPVHGVGAADHELVERRVAGLVLLGLAFGSHSASADEPGTPPSAPSSSSSGSGMLGSVGSVLGAVTAPVIPSRLASEVDRILPSSVVSWAGAPAGDGACCRASAAPARVAPQRAVKSKIPRMTHSNPPTALPSSIGKTAKPCLRRSRPPTMVRAASTGPRRIVSGPVAQW